MSKKGSGSNKSVKVTNGATVPTMVKKGAGVPTKPKPAPKPKGK